MILSNIPCRSVSTPESYHASSNRGARPAIVILLVLVSFTGAAFPQGFDTPEAVLYARDELSKGECGLDCSRKIAGMYGQRFLGLNKKSIVTTLRSSSDRANDARILIGKNISESELEKMSPGEVFALQLMNATSTVPAEYRFTRTEIIARKVVSPNEIYITVRNSGLKADPDLEEEEIIHLIKEHENWKINY